MTTRTSSISISIKPRIKQGATVVNRSTHSYIGCMDRGIEIFTASRSAISQMNGNMSCREIADNLDIPIQEILDLVEILDEAHLLDTETSKILVHNRFHSTIENRPSHSSDDSNDAAHHQLQRRLAPELSFTTWQNNVRDGGVKLVSERRHCSIDIFGASRIATLLYGILLASGFSSTQIHCKEARSISDIDLVAGYLRAADIGLSLHERLEHSSRELSLFPETHNKTADIENSSSQPRHRKIAIAIGEVPADQIQEWMSSGLPHLVIESPDGACLTVGPMVLPGKSPCLRCVAITKEDNHNIWKEMAWQRFTSPPAEVPVAVAHYISGLAALEILRFLDEGISELIGASDRIDYRNPRNSERTLFARHPACGCNW